MVKNLGNTEERQDELWNDMQIWKKIVKWYGNHGGKPSWIVIRYGKYRRKLWNDMEHMEEK